MERLSGDRRVLPRNGRQKILASRDSGHLQRRGSLFRNGSAPATAAAHASKMKDSAVFISCISCDQPPDGFEHLGSGIGLVEVSRTARSFGPCARFRIAVSGHASERNVPAFGHESLAEFDAGHAAEPDVEHQAVELRMLRVCEERLR